MAAKKKKDAKPAISKSKKSRFSRTKAPEDTKKAVKAPSVAPAAKAKSEPTPEPPPAEKTIVAPSVSAAAEPARTPALSAAEAPAAPLFGVQAEPEIMFGVQAISTTASGWQYAKWVWLIARNMRITNPTGTDLAAVKVFLKAFWNPQTQTGTRNWLETPFNKKSVTASASSYQGDIDAEPAHILVEMVGVVGRDLNKIPVQTAEKAIIDTLIAATGNRRYGTGDEFGGAGGSLVTV